MAVDPEARARLAADQAALVRALAGAADSPRGFDPARLGVAADALRRKRAGGVVKSWPALTRGLGADFAREFAAYAATTGPPARGGPLADGRRFAEALRRAGRFPESARAERLAIDLRWRTVRDGLVRRRLPVARLARLRGPSRLVVALAAAGRILVWREFPIGWRRPPPDETGRGAPVSTR